MERFLDRGVSGASIEDVCGSAGASVGSVYHHFGGKEGLAGAVYLEALGDYQDKFLEELRLHPDDAEGGIRGVIGAHLRWCLDDRPDAARFLLFHGDGARGADPDGLDSLNREFLEEVMRWWRPHVRYGVLHDLDLDLAYAIWLGAAQEYCRLWLSDRTAAPVRAAEQLLAEAAWQALRYQGGSR